MKMLARGDEIFKFSTTVEQDGASVVVTINARLLPDMTWHFCDQTGTPIPTPTPPSTGAEFVMKGKAKAMVTGPDGEPR